MNRNLRPVDDLAAFGISAECGFLPSPDPLARLPDGFEPWEEIAATLPKLLVADQHRAALDELPSLEIRGLSSAAEVERAMMLLSYFGHAYVWGGGEPQRRVPASV